MIEQGGRDIQSVLLRGNVQRCVAILNNDTVQTINLDHMLFFTKKQIDPTILFKNTTTLFDKKKQLVPLL